MNWKNVDLTSGYERDQNILDSYDFETLLLEIHCNIPSHLINEETIKKHFEEELKSKIECAKEVFYNNLKNITNQALKESL